MSYASRFSKKEYKFAYNIGDDIVFEILNLETQAAEVLIGTIWDYNSTIPLPDYVVHSKDRNRLIPECRIRCKATDLARLLYG